ncbi:hypothetical protein HMPREF9151_00316 [Hoylesella saccharolytica F0055]|uniref:Uncharacterized protein n=1 Tax=Hoylesella saccharolytica F0055 TaxID=1127699 RepID=L1NJV3_9BACT|nr:hypothetical protein HMPREF9151_00316 [Hoylesella saccharolytica F0055]
MDVFHFFKTRCEKGWSFQIDCVSLHSVTDNGCIHSVGQAVKLLNQ